MKLINRTVICSLGTALLLSFAIHRAEAVTVLTFEGLKDGELIGNFYNGGTGSLGSSGMNYGVSFASGSQGLVSITGGGSGGFANNPSGNTVMLFLGPSATMNVAAGFTTGLSFYYSASLAGSVSIYSGLNATGSVLGTLNLPVTSNPYTVWDPVGTTFGGTAMSVIFSGAGNHIAFDNVTLGSSIAGNPVPDTGSTIALLAVAFAAIAALRIKRA